MMVRRGRNYDEQLQRDRLRETIQNELEFGSGFTAAKNNHRYIVQPVISSLFD
ncbi:hypothetical protein [Bradyrhizobium sp. CIR3A]|uniref:hypothetical protein n=1 Tax=Bradyrhizobium sp. CIR3A TaxID=2663838 RepID=UPI001605ADD9|nr:hypothetical protein [Bradyrhizobium sp. CIR3A]MBB4264144.1 hypothetical protein [Bradyrhizobium sp. CIR3A]